MIMIYIFFNCICQVIINKNNMIKSVKTFRENKCLPLKESLVNIAYNKVK